MDHHSFRRCVTGVCIAQQICIQLYRERKSSVIFYAGRHGSYISERNQGSCSEYPRILTGVGAKGHFHDCPAFADLNRCDTESNKDISTLLLKWPPKFRDGFFVKYWHC